MLNYISAELWRMTRRWQNLIWWGIYLLLVSVMGLVWGLSGLAEALETLHQFLLVGLYLGFPLSALTCGDLWRAGTLGNELSVGLSRSQIYFGKLLTSLLVGVVLLFATIGVFLLSASLWGGRTADGQAQAAAAYLLEGVLISVPRYMGAVALAQCLCFALRASGLAPVVFYLYITIGEVILGAINVYGMGPAGDVINAVTDAVRPFLLGSAYMTYGTLAEPPLLGVGISWLTGLGWLAVSSAAGMLVFARREIK